jgi:RNA polymerase sigma factor (sigma-70 family)
VAETRSLNRAYRAEVVENLQPEIRKAVQVACLLRGYGADRTEIEELCQQIAFLLMEDDCRRLRSFQQRSALTTWLHTVVGRHVAHHLQKQNKTQRLDEMSVDLFVCEPDQEEKMILGERRRALLLALEKLSERERQLFTLLYEEGLKPPDVAKEMRIQPDSVRRRKHALIKKLRELVREQSVGQKNPDA